MPTRAAAPLNVPSLVTTPTISDGGNNNVLSMSRDRTKLYAGQGANGSTQNTLKQSVDDSVTWTNIFTFPAAVVGIHVMDNGEALVAVGHSTGAIYKSTGFAANPATATWAKVLDSSGTNCYFRGEWTLHPWTSAGPVVVINEYGLHTSASGTPAGATKVWLSTDYGTTFTVIFDLAIRFPGTPTQHIHASAYDVLWGRIWVSFGDGNTGATPNSRSGIAYSDDLGVTWTILPGTDVTSAQWQITTIAFLPDCILFGSDGLPAAVFRVRRTGYRQVGPIHAAHLIHGGTGSVVLAFQFWQDIFTPGSPLLMSFNHGGGNPGGISWTCVVMTYDGATFTELLVDRAVTASGSGFCNAVGPTITGKVVGTIKDSRQSNMSKFVAPLYGDPEPGADSAIRLRERMDAQIATRAPLVATIDVKTADYTVVLTDSGKQIEMTSNAVDLTFTVPTNAAVAFPIGTTIEIGQGGTRPVTIAFSAGVTLQSRSSAFKTSGIYAMAAIRKTDTDTWRVLGDVVP